jgi:hypothetical protein
MNNSELKLYSKSEAMKLLSLGKESFNRLISEGYIGVIKINGRDKVPHSELIKFIEENTVKKMTSKPKDDINSFINRGRENTPLAKSIIDNQFFNQLLNEVSNGKYLQ